MRVLSKCPFDERMGEVEGKTLVKLPLPSNRNTGFACFTCFIHPKTSSYCLLALTIQWNQGNRPLRQQFTTAATPPPPPHPSGVRASKFAFHQRSKGQEGASFPHLSLQIDGFLFLTQGFPLCVCSQPCFSL